MTAFRLTNLRSLATDNESWRSLLSLRLLLLLLLFVFDFFSFERNLNFCIISSVEEYYSTIVDLDEPYNWTSQLMWEHLSTIDHWALRDERTYVRSDDPLTRSWWPIDYGRKKGQLRHTSGQAMWSLDSSDALTLSVLPCTRQRDVTLEGATNTQTECVAIAIYNSRHQSMLFTCSSHSLIFAVHIIIYHHYKLFYGTIYWFLDLLKS